jgi:uncharacterized protein YdaU (DUF1376 family)
MARTPWMPLYCDDLISSTADMSVEEFGAYMRLLCHCWTRGPIPIDDKVICRIAGCRLQVWRAIANRFSPCQRDDGTNGLSQTRLEMERLKRQRFAEERAESGRRGAAAKWHGSANGSANGSSMASHNHNHKRTSSVGSTTRAREAAPAFGGAGLPRLSQPDECDDVAERNRAFIAAHRKAAR